VEKCNIKPRGTFLQTRNTSPDFVLVLSPKQRLNMSVTEHGPCRIL